MIYLKEENKTDYNLIIKNKLHNFDTNKPCLIYTRWLSEDFEEELIEGRNLYLSSLTKKETKKRTYAKCGIGGINKKR